jgi:hypothetical protein
MKLSSHEIAYLVLEAGFSESFEAPTMVAIIMATSGGNTDYLELSMRNDLQDQLHGLAGISSQIHSDQLRGFRNWRDGATNLQMAYLIFKNSQRNFGHWEAFNNGNYKDFMALAHYGVETPVKPLPNAALVSEENAKTLEELERLAINDSKTLNNINETTGQLSFAMGTLSRVVSEIRAVFVGR